MNTEQLKTAENDDIQDVRCPVCDYFTTNEDLIWSITPDGHVATCPECGYEFGSGTHEKPLAP